FNQPVFSFLDSEQCRSLCCCQRVLLAITDLFITAAQTAALTSILTPLSGGNFSPEGLYNKNSHLRRYSAKDHAGKYQNALLSANAICKYVTEFSFVARRRRSFIPLFARPSLLILLLSKDCDKSLTLCVIPRRTAAFLYENLTIAYYLAHSSAS
ncbi:MAG: hypothetical protein E6921_09170, partial [Klebsiella michiganensis]|nr:hypothetical protein [Klebsiella michiganensis]MDU1453083.1 hypothetical protein [Enterococcus faecalis]